MIWLGSRLCRTLGTLLRDLNVAAPPARTRLDESACRLCGDAAVKRSDACIENDALSGIRTRDIRLEGEYANHYTNSALVK